MGDQMTSEAMVRVANPTARHRHTLGWEGRLAAKAKGGCWWVVFLGGKGLFHASELESAHLLKPRAG